MMDIAMSLVLDNDGCASTSVRLEGRSVQRLTLTHAKFAPDHFARHISATRSVGLVLEGPSAQVSSAVPALLQLHNTHRTVARH
jgi:hypothetical protein